MALPWFLWREADVRGGCCSQYLAADLCKCGLWSLAPILPLSPPRNILGIGIYWRVDFCRLSRSRT